MDQVQNRTVIFIFSKLGIPLMAVAALSFVVYPMACLVAPLVISLVALFFVISLRYVSNCSVMKMASSITNDIYTEIRFWLVTLTLAFSILLLISPQGLDLVQTLSPTKHAILFVSQHTVVDLLIVGSFLLGGISTWSLFTVVRDCIKKDEPVPFPEFD